MAGTPSPRTLSGEILPLEGQGGGRGAFAGEIEDAVFETVRPERRASSDAPHPHVPSGMDMLAASRSPASVRKAGQPAGPAFWLAGAALALAAFWFSGGHAVATDWIGAAQEPVRLASLDSRILRDGRRPVLLVDGTLRNATGDAAELPRLTVNVTDGEGRLTRYRLGKIDGRIDAHGSWRFSSRLEAPRSGVSAVTVTVGTETSG